MSSIELSVQGMSCQHCVKSITEAVQAALSGTQVEVDLLGGKVVVTSEQGIDKDRVAELIEDLGFDVG